MAKISLDIPDNTVCFFIGLVTATETGLELDSTCITYQDLVDAKQSGKEIICYGQD